MDKFVAQIAMAEQRIWDAAREIASLGICAMSSHATCAGILDALRSVVDYDIGVIMSAAPGELGMGAAKNADEISFSRNFWRYGLDHSLERAPAILRAICSSFRQDHEVFDSRTRDRSPFFAEFTRPAGVRVTVARVWAYDGRIHSLAMMRRSRRFETQAICSLNSLFPMIAATSRLTGLLSNKTVDSGSRFCDDYDLSGRQREIALLIGRGMRNAEIATLLGLSVHTVRNHLVQIFRRARVSNRAELAYLVATHDSSELDSSPQERRTLQAIEACTTRACPGPSLARAARS